MIFGSSDRILSTLMLKLQLFTGWWAEKEDMYRVDVISSKKCTTNLPASLLPFAHQESWTCCHLDEILRGEVKDISHLYLDALLLKSHNPNLLFEHVRNILPDDCLFAFRIRTAENIKTELKEKYPQPFFYTYYPIHFLGRRVLPKLKGFRKISRLLNVPVDISKAEIMGRLLYAGFTIVTILENKHETTILTTKNLVKVPSKVSPTPSEGFLFKTQRIGQGARKIDVYKFRSMHPYAEYVQEYLHQLNGLDEDGKFKNDFRVSTGGRVLRRYWIDEIPMLYNVLRGDLKLIGVRPLSEHYLSLYPEQARQIRMKHRPGLLPPFYADLPKTFEAIVQSELDYLEAYEREPFRTDLRYALRILKNILIYKARSK